MKNRLARAILIVGLSLLLFPSWSEAGAYVERTKKGRIDWSNRIVEAVGVGVAPGKVLNRAQARALAIQNARLAARKNIFEILKMLPIDSKHLARDIVLKNGPLAAKVQEMLYRSEQVEISFLPGNKVRMKIAIAIRGPLADILLPGSIREIEHIKCSHGKRKMDSAKKREKKAFTGLIVDCRGLKVRPAIVPRIVDEDGNEIYGPAIVNRESALRKGVACYMKRLGDALHDARIGKNPMTVKGVRPSGTNSSDIVVANSDAGRIVGTPANLGFLRNADVIIVLE